MHPDFKKQPKVVEVRFTSIILVHLSFMLEAFLLVPIEDRD
jgi:hypothetical protein